MFSTVKELFRGIGAYVEANRVIVKHSLWRYVAIPGILSLCYMLLLIVMGVIHFAELSGYVNQHWIPDAIRSQAVIAITTLLLWLLLLLVGYITYKHIILIVISPFLSYLSEIVETSVYNQPAPDFTLKNFIRDLLRGMVINIRNLMMTLILSFMSWLLVFIPIVGVPLSGVLILLIQFFYNGFSLTDYTLERKRYSVKESVRFVHGNRARVIGVGMGFMLLVTIPVIGWFAAPAYGTVAATLAALEKINEDEQG